jgi:hypothetical protein
VRRHGLRCAPEIVRLKRSTWHVRRAGCTLPPKVNAYWCSRSWPPDGWPKRLSSWNNRLLHTEEAEIMGLMYLTTDDRSGTPK